MHLKPPIPRMNSPNHRVRTARMSAVLPFIQNLIKEDPFRVKEH